MYFITIQVRVPAILVMHIGIGTIFSDLEFYFEQPSSYYLSFYEYM